MTAKGSKSTSKTRKPLSDYFSLRKVCRACGGPLETVLDLGVQQIVNLGDKEKRSAPLELTRCKSCSLVQLRHTVDREYLFRSYYYRSGATQTMREHLKGVVEDVMKRIKFSKYDWDFNGWIDIGSNDGTLLSFCPPNVARIGFEPSGVYPEVPENVYTIDDFFSAERFAKDFGEDRKATVVTAIACFYDLDDPNAFLQDVKKVLAPDGLFVLQVNHLPDTLKNNAVGDICHEHLCYYSLTALDRLLARNRFEIVDWTLNPINGGSIRVFAKSRENEVPYIGWSRETEQENKAGLDTPDPYQAFATRISTIARKTREYIETLRKMGKTVSVIGASTRGATFIQYANLNRYGILNDCVERDPAKVNKFYLGLPIISEEADKAHPADWYLLTTNWFREEIMRRMPHARRFIVPLPEPRIVVDGVETPL